MHVLLSLLKLKVIILRFVVKLITRFINDFQKFGTSNELSRRIEFLAQNYYGKIPKCVAFLRKWLIVWNDFRVWRATGCIQKYELDLRVVKQMNKFFCHGSPWKRHWEIVAFSDVFRCSFRFMKRRFFAIFLFEFFDIVSDHWGLALALVSCKKFEMVSLKFVTGWGSFFVPVTNPKCELFLSQYPDWTKYIQIV